MSTILLTIGSNTFAKTNIDKAKRMLTFVFPDIVFSEPILTEPEEEKYSYLFRNVLAIVETEMRPEEVIDKIKQTERAVGRTPRDKYLGKVVIDIDLIKYDDTILRPQDYEREYVQRLLETMDIPETKETPLPVNENPMDENPELAGDIPEDMEFTQPVDSTDSNSDIGFSTDAEEIDHPTNDEPGES